MKYFSLFSGIGGFELGIQQAYVETNKKKEKRIWEEDKEGLRVREDKGSHERHEKLGDSGDTELRQYPNRSGFGQPLCVGFSEIDKYAASIYQRHFPNHKNYGDITTINERELPDFDLLVGGFPCPSFSIAGKRKGLEDVRGQLVFEIIRILRGKKPKMFLLENVKGLLSHDKGKTMEIICEELCESGYAIDFEVLNSKNFGVPQNRERVFIVGKRLDTLPEGAIY